MFEINGEESFIQKEKTKQRNCFKDFHELLDHVQ